MKQAVIYVPKNTSTDEAKHLLTEVLGKLGCGACMSGYHISFEEIVENNRVIFAADAAKKTVTQFGH